MVVSVLAFAYLAIVFVLILCAMVYRRPQSGRTYRGRRQVLHQSTQGEAIDFALNAGQTIVSVEDATTAMCFYIGTDVLEEKNYDECEGPV